MTFPLLPARWNEGEIPEETASYGKDCSRILGLFEMSQACAGSNTGDRMRVSFVSDFILTCSDLM